MPGGHPNARHPADTRADPVIDYAIDRGYLGSGEAFDIPMPTHDAANQGRLSVNRAARRRNLSPSAWVADAQGEPCYRDCADPTAPHYTRFRLWRKDDARTHVFRTSGGDASKLKYNPWRRKTRRYTDSGELR